MLGRPFGVVSGSALVVDYVLTVTVSIAAAGDALLGLAGPQWQGLKLPMEFGAIIVLIVMNLRGIKESVTILMPIFLVFLFTHAILIAGSVLLHLGAAGEVTTHVIHSVQISAADPNIGILALLLILLRAYSLGAGTFTGIEAVSNSMPVMREPKFPTAKTTMLYMACSLAFTAGGLMIAYLLFGIQHSTGK